MMQPVVDNLGFCHGGDVLGSQFDGIITAYDRDTLQTIAYLNYLVFDDDYYVNMIEVAEPFRRQGIAEKLVQELMRYEKVSFADLRWGLTTPIGDKLYQCLRRRLE